MNHVQKLPRKTKTPTINTYNMLRNNKQNGYYQGIVLQKITEHFNETHKKWYFVKVWTPKIVHEWTKKYYFRDRSTTVIEFDEWEEIMKEIRQDFSKKGVWIQIPGEENEPPIYN